MWSPRLTFFSFKLCAVLQLQWNKLYVEILSCLISWNIVSFWRARLFFELFSNKVSIVSQRLQLKQHAPYGSRYPQRCATRRQPYQISLHLTVQPCGDLANHLKNLLQQHCVLRLPQLSLAETLLGHPAGNSTAEQLIPDAADNSWVTSWVIWGQS